MKLSSNRAQLSAGALLVLSLNAIARADAGTPPQASDDPVPPPITVLTTSPKLVPGYIFVTESGGGAPPPVADGGATSGAPPTPSGQQGPEIIDNQARPVWFNPLSSGHSATDFRVQTYRGQPVVTWIDSTGGGFSAGPTTDYIADSHYQTVATVTAGNGLIADIHEFRLTEQNTALITIYHTVPYDLSSVGGPTNGEVTEGVAQEIDVATGKVLLEWHSLDYVPLSESHLAVPATGAYDYFHINAVNPDVDGNLLISSRHTWTVYKIDRHTGAVIWRLGGKSSDFALGPGVAFAWQHNPLPVDANTIRIFDNESDGVPVLPYSRVIWVQHDDFKKTATLERWFKHPDNLSASATGNSQALDGGHTFVEWGATGRFSEFDGDGNLLFDATPPAGYSSYRAYRHVWVGHPDTIPATTSESSAAAGTTTIHAIWNGATEVRYWDILGGAGATTLKRLETTAWNGLDTPATVTGAPTYVQVVALDEFGAELGRSAVTATVSGP